MRVLKTEVIDFLIFFIIFIFLVVSVFIIIHLKKENDACAINPSKYFYERRGLNCDFFCDINGTKYIITKERIEPLLNDVTIKLTKENS